MTDDEMIIKTLECRIDKFSKDVLALLNRQKAEIDILIRKKSTLRDENSELMAEIERLQEERDAMHRDVITAEEYAWKLNEKLKTAKSEAIREFEVRLIDIAVGNWEHKIDVATIEHVKKEMVGDAV